ncbi:hypothetical protein [Sandaracinobacteroides hominis]|uniref:hypothetical protein n=1 Tax=Sandaracinobacteroides hominis TaxID=2780086 RepID=UPI0018F50290|nr:hypothetical protein [Sandaracinobacteroides hominis]
MTGRFVNWRAGRGLLPLLILCALAIRVAVPAGYMPAFAGGSVNLILCSTAGGGEIAVDFGKARHGPDDPHQKSEMPCLFAAALSQANLPDTGPAKLLPDYSGGADAANGRAIADLTIHRLAAPPPPSLAPPARA